MTHGPGKTVRWLAAAALMLSAGAAAAQGYSAEKPLAWPRSSGRTIWRMPASSKARPAAAHAGAVHRRDRAHRSTLSLVRRQARRHGARLLQVRHALPPGAARSRNRAQVDHAHAGQGLRGPHLLHRSHGHASDAAAESERSSAKWAPEAASSVHFLTATSLPSTPSAEPPAFTSCACPGRTARWTSSRTPAHHVRHARRKTVEVPRRHRLSAARSAHGPAAGQRKEDQQSGRSGDSLLLQLQPLRRAATRCR